MTPARDLPTFLDALRAAGAANRPLRECPSAYPLADYLTEIGEPTAIVWLRALRVAAAGLPGGPAQPHLHFLGLRWRRG